MQTTKIQITKKEFKIILPLQETLELLERNNIKLTIGVKDDATTTN